MPFEKISELSCFTYRELDKIGSLISLIAKKTNGIYLTRLIKYLYSIDELSVKEIGVPVLPFKYKVAEKGPLIVELWSSLPKKDHFKNYTSVIQDKNGGYKITSIGEPNKIRFSEYELEIIDQVIKQYSGYSTEDIIEHLHTHEGSLWKMIVEKEKIDFTKSKISAHCIDFRSHIADNETSSYLYDTYFATRKP